MAAFERAIRIGWETRGSQEALLHYDGSVYHAQTWVAGSAPADGTWSTGDVAWQGSGGGLGWVCTSGGTPGTWTAFGSGSGGDSIQINTTAVTDANFNNTTPAAASGGVNVLWQRSGSGPDSVSAYTLASGFQPFLGLGIYPFPAIKSQPSHSAQNMTNNTHYAVYLGRAWASLTSFNIYWGSAAGVALGTVTYAEIGILTGTAALNGATVNMTVRGTTDISGVLGTAAYRTTAITTSGITAGDDLWIVLGKNATGATPQYRSTANADAAQVGIFYTLAAGGAISALGAGTSYSLGSASVPCPQGAWTAT